MCFNLFHHPQHAGIVFFIQHYQCSITCAFCQCSELCGVVFQTVPEKMLISWESNFDFPVNYCGVYIKLFPTIEFCMSYTFKTYDISRHKLLSTSCYILWLNTDKGQGVIKATNSCHTKSNAIAGNRSIMIYSACCGSITSENWCHSVSCRTVHHGVFFANRRVGLSTQYWTLAQVWCQSTNITF